MNTSLEGLQYTDADIADFEMRLARIYKREVHRVQAKSARQIPDKGDLSAYWIGISSAGDFLGTAPSYTLIRDPILRYLSLFALKRKQGAMILGDLTVIDMTKRVKLQIYIEIDDTWAWVAPGPERQPDVAAGAYKAVEDAPAIDEGAQAVPEPIQAPQPPPLPPPAAGKTMPQILGRLEEDVHGLCQDIVSLHGLVERSMTDQGRLSMWMISCMTQLMEASEQTYQAFNRTFRGSSPAAFERRTR
ncbi:hypothetical protein Tco_0746126 [Tanacetum coccineum]